MKFLNLYLQDKITLIPLQFLSTAEFLNTNYYENNCNVQNIKFVSLKDSSCSYLSILLSLHVT